MFILLNIPRVYSKLKHLNKLNTTNLGAPDTLTIKVLGQIDNSVIQFKLRKNTQLKKLMLAYCDKVGVEKGTIRFRFDGNAIHETDTPASLELEDNDTIEAFQSQIGGTIFLNYC